MDGTVRDAVLKILPARLVISECTGLLVARSLGLTTLEAWLVPAKNQLVFATAKTGIQTIKDAGITYDDDYWDQGVGEEWFRSAFTFDTLIGNFDRVLRNMCFLGKAPEGEFIFMDHDLIFFKKRWSPETLRQTKAASGHNNLARFLPRADTEARNNILRTAQNCQKSLKSEKFNFLDQLQDCGLASEDELAAVKAFLTHRARSLTPLVHAQLNQSTRISHVNEYLMKAGTPGDPAFSVGRLSAFLGVLHQPKKKNRQPVYSARVEMGGASHKVALKILSPKAVANECAASLVGKHLGFTTLDPFLVLCPPELLDFINLKFNKPQVFFATRLSTLKTMNTNPEAQKFEFWTRELNAEWFRTTFVFDVLVGNEDRVMKNLFFTEVEGKDHYVLLDHQMCLFGTQWTAENLRTIKRINGDNFLNKWLSLCTEQVLDGIIQTANSWRGNITPEVLSPLEVLVDLGVLDKDELKSVFEFLTWRSENLSTLVMKQINLERPYPSGM
ncbi:MAG: hypothetical protein IH901_07065 [Proteobacteria bacterium]|nr:hypothetical protein [Pseudomonadota bacterium]